MIDILINIPLDEIKDFDEFTSESNLKAAAEKKAGISFPDESKVKLIKKQLDTSDRSALKYKLIVSVSLDDKTETWLCRKYDFVRPSASLEYKAPSAKTPSRPVVVGSGPAGLFAALILAESGAKPIVLERGGDVDSRVSAVKKFFDFGELDPESNIQFGEGGAGTFSDGKLKPGKIDKIKYKILTEFVLAGAPEEILYRADAHIGTDNLLNVVKNLRKKIESLGGEVRFNCKAEDISVQNGKLISITASGEEIPADKVILATGHSARDIFRLLDAKGAALEAKNFGIGVRVEHPQELINELIYGRHAKNKSLGAASYHLVTHLDNGRSVYSFCMCPGGTVVAAASDAYGVVTNGMSSFSRNGDNANAALLVSVTPDDFKGEGPLAGIEFQRQLEMLAYRTGGGKHVAVSQRMEDFMNHSPTSRFGSVLPTYGRGCVGGKIDDILPDYVASSLRSALVDFDNWMKGYYYPDALLTGTETRSTSPIRVLRNSNCEAVGISGLYPCGEGAGYAGGILSAAYDGIICAEHVLRG